MTNMCPRPRTHNDRYLGDVGLCWMESHWLLKKLYFTKFISLSLLNAQIRSPMMPSSSGHMSRLFDESENSLRRCKRFILST